MTGPPDIHGWCDRARSARLTDIVDGELVEVPDSQLFRIIKIDSRYATKWNALRTYGPVGSRFDPQSGDIDHATDQPDNGVAYLGDSFQTAVLETFHSSRNIDTQTLVPTVFEMRIAQPLMLLDLSSGWASRTGLDQHVHTMPRIASSLLAQRMRKRYPDLQGLLHRSVRNGSGFNVVVWNPGRPALDGAELLDSSLLSDSRWILPIREIRATHGYSSI